MVKTATLSEKVGDEKAVQFMNGIKQEIANNKPQTVEELKNLIADQANQLEYSVIRSRDQRVSFFYLIK